MIINKKPLFFWEIVEYAMYGFFAIFPFVIFLNFLYGGSATRSITLIGLSCVLGIWGAAWLWQKGNTVSIPKSLVALTLVLYGVVLTLAGYLGLNFSTSFWSVATRTTGIWYFLCLIIFLFLLWGILQSRVRQYKLLLALVASSAVYSFLSLLGPEGFNIVFKSFALDAFTFGNSSFAGMYLLGSFLLAIYYLLQATRKVWWMYVLPVIIILSPSIINSKIFLGDFSRGFVGEARASAYAIFFSLVCLAGIWVISKIKSATAKTYIAYAIFVTTVVLAIVASFSLVSHDGLLRKFYLNQATGARPLVWEMSEKVIGQRPWLGWGSDNFERVFETNYDNRLLEEAYGNEAWFDRAHNVLIDQLVDTGIIGLVAYMAVYIVLGWSLVYVGLNAVEKRDRLLAGVLLVYFPLHFIELQTAFDTSISYPMLGLMTVLAIVLFDRVRAQKIKQGSEWLLGDKTKRMIAIVVMIFCLFSLVFGLMPFVRAQQVNSYIRTIGLADKRIVQYPVMFTSSVDPYAFLWRASTDFQRGIAEDPTVLSDSRKVELLKKEAVVFENQYRQHIKENPTHFRAYLGLADILIYQRLFDVDKLQEAQQVLDDAIKLVPQAPQAYWMKAVAYLYMNQFDAAREYARKALDLNPQVEQSQDVSKYIEESIKTFPEIDLYFFRQI